MKLKAKIFLLALVPFVIAMLGIAIGVRHQATTLAKAQDETMRAAYMSSKEIELRHYVEVAQGAIAPLYEAGANNARDDALLRQRALAVLEKMDFGPDGYFFVYDLHGRSLMHPREPELVGQDLWMLRDPQGSLTIQRLITAAKHGGGYVQYLWQRPSTGKLAPKLGYVVPLQRWGWMIGTGIYLDDVTTALDHIDRDAAANIQHTMLWIGAIALAALAVIAVCALVLNVSEYRSTDVKLKRLAQQVVQSQEAERARLSRELHDGIGQMLVSVKLLLESASTRFERSESREPKAEAALSTSLGRLSDTLREVRRISHALRPALLDDLGLPSALEQLTREFNDETSENLRFTLDADRPANELPDDVVTALYRIAQEGLTNVVRHAQATHCALTLRISPTSVVFTITDNGRGFAVDRTLADPRAGLGLRNMRERLDPLGGVLTIASQPGSTVVNAQVPLAGGRPKPDKG